MKKKLLILSITLTSLNIFSQNINTEKLNDLLKKSEESHSESVIVYQDNKLITEKYFGIGKATTKIEAMSTTKSIIGLAVSCMLDDKLLDSLDVPVYKFYPEWNQGQKKLITIRHLVNMTSGLQNERLTSVEIYPSKDFVQLGLCAELSNKPGEIFSYNNKSLNLMAGIIKQITGKRMDKYIGERLFKPLGIKDFTWSFDASGNPHVMSGCQIKPNDFIKIGLLLMNNGKYNNKQIIGEKFIKQVVIPCKQSKKYGMLWWLDYSNTTYIIDDEIIEEYKTEKLNDEFIQNMIKCKGVFVTQKDFFSKMIEVFGEKVNEIINKNLTAKTRLFKEELSGDITYSARGYLGNYIIVNPKTKIVALRMISATSYKKEGVDDFNNFEKLVNNLTN